jgi:hypothetical protein
LRGAATVLPVQTAPTRADLFRGALDQCRAAVADYQAGLLDDAGLICALDAAGSVRIGNTVWVADLVVSRWCNDPGRLVASAPPNGFSRADLDRLRASIDHLSRSVVAEPPQTTAGPVAEGGRAP